MSTSLDVLLRSARAELAEAGIDSPHADAELLLAAALDVSRSEVLRRALLGHRLEPSQATAYLDTIQQRAHRVPLQHLTGFADFAGVRLAVGPGVFVPRPETELLVARADELAASIDSAVIVDLCTGSGAIALALKHRLPSAAIYAVERSPSAHAWAHQNVTRLAPEIDLRLGDARTEFSELVGQVDVVTCNPPYIPTGAVPVDPEVHLHDPAEALYGDSVDGLAIPISMVARAAELLRSGGFMVMEHAETQGQLLVEIVQREEGWSNVHDHRDWAGRPRMLEAVRA